MSSDMDLIEEIWYFIPENVLGYQEKKMKKNEPPQHTEAFSKSHFDMKNFNCQILFLNVDSSIE